MSAGRLGWELDGWVETEVKDKGSEAVTHIPSIFSRVSLIAFLTHRPPDPGCPLRRAAGLRWTLLGFAGFPISCPDYVPHHHKVHDRVSHHPTPPCGFSSLISSLPEPLATSMSKSPPPSCFDPRYSPGGHARLLFQANLGHPGDGEESHSVRWVRI